MRLGFQYADFEAMAKLWNSWLPKRYCTTAEQIKLNTVDSPVFDWGASGIEVLDDRILAFVAIKRSANPLLYRGPEYDQAHVCALVCPHAEAGVDLMSYAKGVLRSRGVYKLIFGQDSRHFFPGCPTDCKALTSFLEIEGFVAGSLAHDVEATLTPSKPSSNVRHLVLGDDTKILDDLLRREFSARWRFDTAAKIEAEGRADFVYGLFVEEELAGFAVTQDQSHKLPIAGANWRADLGSNWCTLGPIGIAKHLRGKGYGDELLASSLAHLATKGLKRCLIDWTVLTDWYAKHGFQSSRQYCSYTLRLD